MYGLNVCVEILPTSVRGLWEGMPIRRGQEGRALRNGISALFKGPKEGGCCLFSTM